MGLQRRHWNEISQLDDLWAILSDPERRHHGWALEEFLATGRDEIDQVLSRAREWAIPARRERALDFGTGVGRIARALSQEFDIVVGVDISDVMVSKARALNADRATCRFDVIDRDGLESYDSRSFDLIYSRLVLQHITDGVLIERHLRDFVRLLADGGLLVFQLPSRIPFRRRLQPRPRLYAGLRRLRVPAPFLYETLGLHPIRMNSIDEHRVIRVVTSVGGVVLAVDRSGQGDAEVEDRMYYLTVDREAGA